MFDFINLLLVEFGCFYYHFWVGGYQLFKSYIVFAPMFDGCAINKLTALFTYHSWRFTFLPVIFTFFYFVFNSVDFFVCLYLSNFINIVFIFWLLVSQFFLVAFFVFIIIFIFVFFAPYVLFGFFLFILYEHKHFYSYYTYGTLVYSARVPFEGPTARRVFRIATRHITDAYERGWAIRRIEFLSPWFTGNSERFFELPFQAPIFFGSLIFIIFFILLFVVASSCVYAYFIVFKLVMFNVVSYFLYLVVFLFFSLKNLKIECSIFEFVPVVIFLFCIFVIYKVIAHTVKLTNFNFFALFQRYILFIFNVRVRLYWSRFILFVQEKAEVMEFIFYDESEYVYKHIARTYYPSVIDW